MICMSNIAAEKDMKADRNVFCSVERIVKSETQNMKRLTLFEMRR